MAITKVTGALVDIGDLDLTNVGTLHLDSIVSDASPAAITIGYGPADTLTINGLTTMTTDGNGDTLTLTSTDTDSSFGPNLNFYRNSSNPADDDLLAQIDFNGRNDNTQDVLYANIQTQIIDASDGTEDGRFQINTIVNGTDRNRFLLTPTETVLNDNSIDLDFRVESNGDTHRLFIDGGNDRVLIGTTASRTMSGVTPDFFIEGTSYADSGLGAVINANGAIDCPVMLFGKSRGTSLGSNTVVQNGDRLFTMRFDGSDGTNLEQAALIEAYVDAAPANNSVPGRLSFWTTNDGAQYSTEKMRIDNAGRVTMPLQPAFCVLPSSSQDNIAVTTAVTVVFGTERFDLGSNFASNTFTAPVTGKYQFNAVIRFDNADSAALFYQLGVVTDNESYTSYIDPDFGQDTPYWTLNVSVLADMDANDTAYVTLFQHSGTQQTDVQVDSWFSGYLVA